MTDKPTAEEAPAEPDQGPVDVVPAETPAEPEPKPEPGTVEVVVIGSTEIDGRSTGDVLFLPVVQAWQLVRGGHVALAKKGKAMAPAEQARALDKLLQEV